MSSSKPSSSSTKRKPQWPDIEDSFSTTKKPRVVRSNITSFNPLHDFAIPPFEPRQQATKFEQKPSLHDAASDLMFKKGNKAASSKPSVPLPRLDTPKPPRPFLLSKPPSTDKNLLSVLEMVPPKIDQVSNTPEKPMRSALRTPLIAGVFASPPASQELTITLSQLLDEGSSPSSPRKSELEQGLAPSPEKGPSKGLARGGLADRAKALMSRATTDYSLWYEDALSGRKAKDASITLHVIEIIASNPSKQPPIISNPYLYTTSVRHSLLSRCIGRMKDRDIDEEFTVLFSCLHPDALGARKRVANPLAVSVGSEVQIWEPWTEVEIPPKVEGPSTVQTKVILCSKFIVK